MRARFPHVDLLDSMQIFEPAFYPEDPNALLYWGNVHINVLLQHFGERQLNKDGLEFDALIHPDVCQGEFFPFKRLFHRNQGENKLDENGVTTFSYNSSTQMMEILFGPKNKSNRTVFSEMFKLMTACHCILVGNSEAERVFSCQNRIKTKQRSNLTVEHLDQLIRLSHNFIPLEGIRVRVCS